MVGLSSRDQVISEIFLMRPGYDTKQSDVEVPENVGASENASHVHSSPEW